MSAIQRLESEADVLYFGGCPTCHSHRHGEAGCESEKAAGAASEEGAWFRGSSLWVERRIGVMLVREAVKECGRRMVEGGGAREREACLRRCTGMSRFEAVFWEGLSLGERSPPPGRSSGRVSSDYHRAQWPLVQKATNGSVKIVLLGMVNKAFLACLAEHALALVCSQAVKTVGLLPLTKENCDLESMSRRWREAQVRSKVKSVRKLREHGY